MKKRFLKWVLSTFGVAIIYILGMLIFRESHPFSRFNMYSTFPNWSYSFYLTNGSNQIIPFDKLNTNGGRVGHLYGSVCDDLQIIYGDFVETNKELEKIGNGMLNVLLKSNNLSSNKIHLYRKGFYLRNDSIIETTDLMTTYEVD